MHCTMLKLFGSVPLKNIGFLVCHIGLNAVSDKNKLLKEVWNIYWREKVIDVEKSAAGSLNTAFIIITGLQKLM